MRSSTSNRTSIGIKHIGVSEVDDARVKVSNAIHGHSMVLTHGCRCVPLGHATSCAAMDFSAAFSKVIVLARVAAAVALCAACCSIE
jgi:hypothetical protein